MSGHSINKRLSDEALLGVISFPAGASRSTAGYIGSRMEVLVEMPYGTINLSAESPTLPGQKVTVIRTPASDTLSVQGVDLRVVAGLEGGVTYEETSGTIGAFITFIAVPSNTTGGLTWAYTTTSAVGGFAAS